MAGLPLSYSVFSVLWFSKTIRKISKIRGSPLPTSAFKFHPSALPPCLPVHNSHPHLDDGPVAQLIYCNSLQQRLVLCIMHKVFSPNQIRILRTLLQEPQQPLSMSEIGRRLGKRPGTFQRGLNALQEAGIIQSIRRTNVRLVTINPHSPFYSAVKDLIQQEQPYLPTDVYLTYLSNDHDEASTVAEPPGMYASARRKILIIAGPNGAGKTTFAREYLPNEAQCHVFINADYIAHGLSPFDPDKAALKAGKIMISEIENHIEHQRDIAIETTLSGKRYARLIPQWQAQGYAVKLIFLSLANVELSIARVACRIRQGGHAIPEPTIRRRFEQGRNNFELHYKPLVDAWVHFDNSGTDPILVAEEEQ